VRLLRRQLDQISTLPTDYLFQNYLRCHDDIGWGLDYPWLKQFGIEEVSHKKYMNDWFTGKWAGSWSRGELYNDDPRLGDARLCGTTASLCGMESENQELAMDCDIMLHAWMFTQSGIPVLYSGDEVGQLNDYTYHEDPEKRVDSRYLHRGSFDWEKAALRRNPDTVQGRLFSALRKLETIRASEQIFQADAGISTFDTGSNQVLGVTRERDGEVLVALFNFSEHPQKASIPAGSYLNLKSGDVLTGAYAALKGYGYAWLKEKL
jgi:amylosucrase